MADKIRRVSLSTQENKELSEVVRKYSCIYDKSKQEYKDKNVTENAWKEIASQLDFITDASRARSCFENLKKNYTKKRSSARLCKKSGTSRESVEKAEQQLNQLSFLSWIDVYIRPRKSKSSFDAQSDTPQNSNSVHDTDFTYQSDLDHNNGKTLIEDDLDNDENINNEEETEGNFDKSHEIPVGDQQQSLLIKKPVHLKRKSNLLKEREEIDKEKLAYLKTIDQRVKDRETRNNKTGDIEDRFVTTVADKLRQLPARERLLAKHEIENVLFKYQLECLEKETNQQTVSPGMLPHSFQPSFHPHQTDISASQH